MSASSRPMPVWLKWLGRVFSLLLVIGTLWPLGLTVLEFWRLAHSKAGLMEHSGKSLEIVLAKLLGEFIVIMFGVWLLQRFWTRKEQTAEGVAAQAVRETTLAAPAKAARRSTSKRWNSANVLQLGADFRQLWGFSSSKGRLALNQEHSIPVSEPLPAKLVVKDWKSLFQPKLNVAWLPVDQVFVRVTQLPVGDFEETLSMVELQLEKLSPLPVTHIVWSIHVLPHHVDNLQTVIITIVARDLVEEYLGQLEGQGYLADRLELPMLDQLQATPITGDGAWIYPGNDTGKFTALVAWWYGGVLRNLALLHVPAAENRDAVLKEQLNQMAWAGELEGWLTSQPNWHLVADEATAANWQPMLNAGLGQPAEIISPLAESELAALTANRAAHASPNSNILPIEYATRYHQQFVDGLWMRGLAAGITAYLAIVVIYLAALGVQNYRTETKEEEMRGLSGSYTNTLQLKAQLKILQDRQALKNAALDCWKITAELLPEGLTVQSLELKNGKTFTLFGSASADSGSLVTDFNDAMRKAPLKGQPFFSKMDLALTHVNGNNLSWSFSGELARAEEESQ